ncbi:MAG: MFS transporter [Sphingobium sp.]|nr:MFS transporter [Sphingobium sp.]
MKATRVRYGVVGLAVSLAVLSYIQRVAISQAATPIAADLHLDKAQLGAVLGAFGLAYAAFEMPMGLLGDKLGVRRVLTQIVLAWSCFTALTGAAWDVTSLWIIRFLFGAGEAGCFPNLTRMLGQWLPRGERVKAQSIMWASTRWGGALAPPLALFGIQLFGWRWSFVAFALLGVMWVAVFRRSFHEHPAHHPRVNEAEKALLAEPAAMAHGDGESWTRVLMRPQTLLLVVQYFCWSYVWYFFVTWLPTWLQEAHGQSAAATAGLSTLPMIAGGLGTLASGWIPHSIPRRWIAVAAYSAVTLLLLVLPQAGSVGMAIALMAAISFCGDLTVPISWNSCVELGRRYTATVSSTMNMFGNFSGFIAPAVTGIILKQSGNDWNQVLHLMTGVPAVGAVIWLFIDVDGKSKTGIEA